MIAAQSQLACSHSTGAIAAAAAATCLVSRQPTLAPIAPPPAALGMAAELEAELQAQLAEQQEALEGVRQLLAADPDSAETAELLAELQAGIAETESALLDLKRQRLLEELDAMHGGASTEQPPQQQQGWPPDHLPVQQQADGGESPAGSSLQPGSTCVFRHTDGRWYYGAVEGSSNGSLQLRFAFPTR